MEKIEFQILNKLAVVKMLGISTPTLWRMMRTDKTFPSKVQITVGRVGWLKHEIEAWILAKKVE